MGLRRTWLLAGVALLFAAAPANAEGQAAALTGMISSPEGALEGVVVSAKKEGSIVTISVVSDAKGAFSFPAAKLGPGTYALSIRAAGYDLDGPSVATLADTPAAVDLKLVKTKNLAAQLTNQEWITSVPGADDQKKFLFNCTNCHSVERIVESTHDTTEFLAVMQRMSGYSNNSFFLKPQLRATPRAAGFGPNPEKNAAFLASINRSTGDWKFPLQTQPRVSGDGTKVVITEYDLPRKESQPHDVYVEPDGTVWYSDFGSQFLGRLDTKTLQYKEFPVPVQREGFPKGALNLAVDPQGNFWLALMFQAGTAKFDKASEKFTMFQLPPEFLNPESQQAFVGATHWTVDNKIWLQDPSFGGVYHMDLTSGQTQKINPFENLPKGPHGIYGIYPDQKNNLWFLDFGSDDIGRIDAATDKVSIFTTPTPGSRPRRGHFDDHGHLWFAEFAAEKIAMFDTATEQFKEWALPSKFFAPYDAVRDKRGFVWTAGMNADRILRLDPASGQFVEYPLPHYTNVRQVGIDDSTSPPTFWIGNNHGASLIKVEPLD